MISAFYPAAEFNPGDASAQRDQLVRAFADQGWEWPRLLDARLVLLDGAGHELPRPVRDVAIPQILAISRPR